MLTAERLREIMIYDPTVGEFRWRHSRSGRRTAGRVAGNVGARGYRTICIDGQVYYCNRLVWLYVTGEWPTRHVDHINRKRDDDRIANLRIATKSENHANQKVRSDSASGVKGVSRKGNVWQAVISKHGRRYYLGLFSNPRKACAAYRRVARRLYGEFAEAA